MLIAEIGNSHFGDMQKAKDLIRAAMNAGATLVKGQAFKAEDLTSGSMHPDFYRQCQFSLAQYIELIEYARAIGTDLFYSIFSKELEPLMEIQRMNKVSASQSSDPTFKIRDEEHTIVSVKYRGKLPHLLKAQILHVSEYVTDNPDLYAMGYLRQAYLRPIGYSDHTVGAKAAIHAIEFYGAHIIEKHFHIGEPLVFKGKTYRDCLHAADEKVLTQIANAMYS